VVTLDASASTDKEDRIEGYDWATGDGTTSAGVTVTHTYERPGEFTVTLRVTDHKGKTSTASQVVTVENRPPVAAFTATPESGAAPLVVVFDASASNDPDGSIEQYAWEFPAGTASGEIVQHRFEEPGEFEVTLRVTDDFGATPLAWRAIH
jgi:PKD repeat protein